MSITVHTILPLSMYLIVFCICCFPRLIEMNVLYGFKCLQNYQVHVWTIWHLCSPTCPPLITKNTLFQMLCAQCTMNAVKFHPHLCQRCVFNPRLLNWKHSVLLQLVTFPNVGNGSNTNLCPISPPINPTVAATQSNLLLMGTCIE